MKTKFATISVILLALSISLSHCKKATEEDKALYEKAKNTTGFTYYKNDNSILPSSNPSAHNPYFRVRFNDIAQAALGPDGKLPVDSVFPEGSIMVKELYNSQNGPLALYAVMEKNSGNAQAGVNWLWAEYKPDGKLGHSVNQKGDGCISCHSVNQRDYSRIFDLF